MNLRPREFERPTKVEANRWQALHEGWRELRAMLSKVPLITTREVTFEPTATLSIEMAPPEGLMLVKLVRVDNGTSAAVNMHWTSSNTGRVNVYGLGGLSAGQWRATFMVIGG